MPAQLAENQSIWAVLFLKAVPLKIFLMLYFLWRVIHRAQQQKKETKTIMTTKPATPLVSLTQMMTELELRQTSLEFFASMAILFNLLVEIDCIVLHVVKLLQLVYHIYIAEFDGEQVTRQFEFSVSISWVCPFKLVQEDNRPQSSQICRQPYEFNDRLMSSQPARLDITTPIQLVEVGCWSKTLLVTMLIMKRVKLSKQQRYLPVSSIARVWQENLVGFLMMNVPSSQIQMRSLKLNAVMILGDPATIWDPIATEEKVQLKISSSFVPIEVGSVTLIAFEDTKVIPIEFHCNDTIEVLDGTSKVVWVWKSSVFANKIVPLSQPSTMSQALPLIMVGRGAKATPMKFQEGSD